MAARKEPGFEWYIYAGKDLKPVIRDIIETLKRYGLPWMHDLADRRKLLDYVLNYSPKDSDVMLYIVAAMYVLLGEKEQAREYVKKKAS